MPLALGLLLVLPLVGALHQPRDNEALGFSRNETRHELRGFSVTRILPEGELRRITRWNGLCAKETILDWGETSVALREVVLRDSRRKLQLVYEGEELTDCVDEALAEGEDAERCSPEPEEPQSNEARIQILEKRGPSLENSNSELRWLATIRELRKRCSDAKTRTRNLLIARQSHRRRTERSLRHMVIAPGTKWCGPHSTANSYKELGGLDQTDRCCRRHDHCYRAIPAFSTRYNLWNYMPFTLSHCGCDQRKRSARASRRRKRVRRLGGRAPSRNRRELLLIPGTQWCGRGNRATKYTNLGGFGKADACCRRHDTACPFYIPAFESRYGLFNWGISTVMHCTCDERFRTCLKMAGTSSANFIGRIFFNVVQTKCFVLKPQKVCVKQNWWGRCEKHEYKKQAHLRDNVPY